MVLTDGTLKSGKYRGYKISDREVDAGYLRFLYWQCDFGEQVASMIAAELRYRKEPFSDAHNNQQSREEAKARRSKTAPPAPKGGTIDPEMAILIIAAGRKVLAKNEHPDVGGDSEKMKLINSTADALIQIMEKYK